MNLSDLAANLWPFLQNLLMVGWTDWTPTVTQSGAVTVTVNEAKYAVIGKVLHLYAKLTVTGPGTGANAIVIGGLPIALAYGGVDTAIGTGVVVDTGTANYTGALVAASVTTLKIVSHSNGYIGVYPDFALAATDVITLSGTYRVA